MSSFIRRIQRTVSPSNRYYPTLDPLTGKKRTGEYHRNPPRESGYQGRGSKLGYTNPNDPCRNRSLRKTPKPWRAPQHAPDMHTLRPKISVAATPVRSTRSDRKGLHVVKMARKKERNERVYQAFVAHYARAARASA